MITKFLKGNKRAFLTPALVVTLFAVLFFDVLFLGKTLRGEPYAQGVLPSGPVFYNREVGDFQGHLNDPGASAWNNNPPFVIALEQLKQGYLPWWNPYNGTGTPLLASLQSGIMFPPKLALLFLDPSPFMFDIYAIFRILMAFVFTYLFLRLLKITKPISFVAAFAFAFSGSLFRYINLEHTNIDAFIPFYVFTAEYFLQKQTFRRWALFTFALTLMILGGFPEASLFAVILVSCYFLFRWYTTDKRFGAVKRWFLANITALALSAPVVIPFVIHMAETWTIHEPGSHVGTLFLPFSVIFSLVTPWFFNATMLSRLNIDPGLLIPGWVGGAVLMTSVMALFNLRKGYLVGAFFAAFGILSILKDFGFPGINLIGYFPLISQSIVFKYNNPALTFSLVVASAFFLQSLLDSKPTKMQIGSALGFFTIFYLAFILQFHHGFVDFTISRQLLSAATTIPLYLLLLLFVFALGVLTLLLITLTRFFDQKRVRILVVVLLLGIIVVEAIVSLPKYHPRRDKGYPEVAFLTDLREKAGDDYRVSGRDYVLFPDFSGPYKILDPRILDAMYLEGYYEYVKTIDSTFYDRFINLSNEWLKTPATLKASGVKYVLATNSLEEAANITDLGRDYQLPKGSYTISGETRSILSVHPPFAKKFKVTIPENTSNIYFYLAFNPDAWDPSKGDGVCLDVVYLDKSQNICSDPKNKIEDRVWKKIEIPVPQRTPELDLEIKVTETGSFDYDWAGITDIVSLEESKKIQDTFTLTTGFPVRQDNLNIYSYTLNESQKIAYYPEQVTFVNENEVSDKVKSSLSTIDKNVIAQGDLESTLQQNLQNIAISMKPNGDINLELSDSHPKYVYLSQAHHKNLTVADQSGRELKWYKANLGFILIDSENASEVRITNGPNTQLRTVLIGAFVIGILLIGITYKTWGSRRR